MDYNSYYLNQATRPLTKVQIKNPTTSKLGQIPKDQVVVKEEAEEEQEQNEIEMKNIDTEIVKSTSASIKRPAKTKSYVILKKKTKTDIFNK